MPPKKTFVFADVGFIGQGGGVDRQQDDVVSLAFELRRQRVVADATAAVHLRGAGGECQDLHNVSRVRSISTLLRYRLLES